MTRTSKVKSATVKPVQEINPVKEAVKPVEPVVQPTDSSDLLKLLASLQQQLNLTQYGQPHVEQLRSAYQELVKTHRFKVGQLVVWKKGLQNKKLPELNQPAIVVEVFEKPRFETNRDPGSPYYAEALDLILGLITPEGEFLTFCYDQRRFEPYELPKEKI